MADTPELRRERLLKTLPEEIAAKLKAVGTPEQFYEIQSQFPSQIPAEAVSYIIPRQTQTAVPTAESTTPETTNVPKTKDVLGGIAAPLTLQEGPDRLEDDKRFKNILANTVEDWNIEHPNELFKGELLIKDPETGKRIINPTLPPHLRESAILTFRDLDEVALGKYSRHAANPVYDDPSKDPAYRELQEKIQQLRATRTPNQATPVVGLDDGSSEEASQRLYEEFFKSNPHRAVRYVKKAGKSDPSLETAYQKYQARLKKEEKRRQDEAARLKKDAKKIYKDASGAVTPQADITVQYVEGTIASKTAAEIQRQETERIEWGKRNYGTWTRGRIDRSGIEDEIRRSEFKRLARANRKKAEAYAAVDPRFADALEAIKAEDAKKGEEHKPKTIDDINKELNEKIAAIYKEQENELIRQHRPGQPLQKPDQAVIEQAVLEDFAKQNPKQAEKFAQTDSRIRDARERLIAKEKRAKELAQHRGVLYNIKQWLKQTKVGKILGRGKSASSKHIQTAKSSRPVQIAKRAGNTFVNNPLTRAFNKVSTTFSSFIKKIGLRTLSAGAGLFSAIAHRLSNSFIGGGIRAVGSALARRGAQVAARLGGLAVRALGAAAGPIGIAASYLLSKAIGQASKALKSLASGDVGQFVNQVATLPQKVVVDTTGKILKITGGVIGGIFLLIIIIIIALLGGQDCQPGQEDCASIVPVNISKVGPEEVPNPTSLPTSDFTTTPSPDPSDIRYNIQVSFPGEAESIIVTDKIDDNAVFVSAEGPIPGRYDPATRTVTWEITPGNYSQQPQNTAVPANQSTCGGAYRLHPEKGNFGDPNCEMLSHQNAEHKDRLYQLLKEKDPQDADAWFNTVIPCESGYNPNAHNPNSASGFGAFGL
jgi:hypothetical protein